MEESTAGEAAEGEDGAAGEADTPAENADAPAEEKSE
jgi:hypothetical protein